MRFDLTMTDAAVLREIGDRIAQHRLHRNLTQAQLAREAGVSRSTLVRLEAGESAQLSNLIRVLRALEFVEGFEGLIPPLTPGPLEQLRSNEKRRRRATGQAPERPAGAWTWADDGTAADGESGQ